MASLGKLGDDLLQVEIAVALVVDELRHLIGQKDKAVVVVLVFQVGVELHAEAIDADSRVTVDDALADTFLVKSRCKLTGNVEHHAKLIVYDVCRITGVVPVAAKIGNTLLELLENAFLLQGLLKVLSQ